MCYLGVVRKTALMFLLAAFAGCSPKGERLFGPVKGVIGIDGDFQGIRFKGTSADAQAIAMILVAGVPTEPAKWKGRGWMNLHYADDRILCITIAEGADVVFMGDNHLQVRLPQLIAIIEQILARK